MDAGALYIFRIALENRQQIIRRMIMHKNTYII